MLVRSNLGLCFFRLFSFLCRILAEVKVHGAHTGEGLACFDEKENKVMRQLWLAVKLRVLKKKYYLRGREDAPLPAIDAFGSCLW